MLDLPEVTLTTLVITAAVIGLVHTATGPDHFLPFIAMSRSGSWTLGKTIGVTTICGIAHVASSVVLGAIGLAIGTAVARLVTLEEWRGNVAGWLLLGFGIAYTVWGARRAYRNRPHTHLHSHADGTFHSHQHVHDAEHAHVHGEQASLTPWIIFLIFVFGPCEPLIPLLMYPAAESSLWGTALVTLVFGAVTLATMLSIVVLGYLGTSWLTGRWMERYAHLACGVALTACGLAVSLGL